MMDSIIKSVLARYLKTDSADINGSTVIDKTAVKGSILVHRMYSELATAGFTVPDYMNIKTVGHLMERLSVPSAVKEDRKTMRPISNAQDDAGSPGIGIDIEIGTNLPVCEDYREHAFYTQNFTMQEISYCIMQPDPLVSFTGLFAAKEAIVKADNRYLKTPFNQIEVDHTMAGIPVRNGFDLSISHVKEFAIAIAIRKRPSAATSDNVAADDISLSQESRTQIEKLQKKLRRQQFIASISLLVSLVAMGGMFMMISGYFQSIW